MHSLAVDMASVSFDAWFSAAAILTSKVFLPTGKEFS